MNAEELVNEHWAPVEWIAEGLFRPGLIVIAAEQSAGKTTLLNNGVVEVVAGLPMLGHYAVPKPRPVLFCTTELDPADVARPIEKQFKTRNLELSRDLHIYTDLLPAAAGGTEDLASLIEDLQPGVVVIDLFEDFDPVPNTRGPARIKAVRWNTWARKRNVALVASLHAYRGGIPLTGRWMHKVVGSMGFLGGATIRAGLAREQGTNRSVLRVTGKGSQDHDLELRYDPETDRLTAADAPADKAEPDTLTLKRQLIFDVIAAQEPPGIKAIEIAPLVQRLAVKQRSPIDPKELVYDRLRQIMFQMKHNAEIPIVAIDGKYYTESQLTKMKGIVGAVDDDSKVA